MVSPTYSWRLSEHAYELDADGHHSIADLTDVDLTGLAVDDILIWDGSDWVVTPGAPSLAHVAEPTDAHDASAISIADAGGYYAGADVEAALQEIGAGGIGGGGGGGIELTPEVPAGTIDGANDTFTLSTTPDGIILFKNGLLQREGSGEDYTIATNTITYEAGNEPQVGDTHIAYLNNGVTGEILDHTTAEMDDTLVLAPDGAGGVEFRAEAGGGGGLPLNYFGTGRDGSTTINSGTFSFVTAAGETLINSNVLARDAYFDDLTLNGGDLDTNGFRLFVQGTLTMTSGVIKNNGVTGNNGGNGTAGAGGAAGAGVGAASAGNLGTSSNTTTAGQIGGFNANGLNGIASASVSTHGHTASNAGVAGGASGAGQTGGTGAAATVSTFTTLERFDTFWAAWTGRPFGQGAGGVAWAAVTGQPGGSGSGAGSAASGGGGSGSTGSTGGPIVISAYTITGTTNIQSVGGTGGNGGNGGGTNAGGGGGGNGGNGGCIFLTTHDLTGWSGSLASTGGTGGNGGSGIGTGSNGSNGNSGIAGITISQVV